MKLDMFHHDLSRQIEKNAVSLRDTHGEMLAEQNPTP